jgi:mannose-6-phosphate isomerase-like protein (cupin superfamily)
VVVGAGTPHKFKNVGTDRLDVVCIHASPRMTEEWLEE